MNDLSTENQPPPASESTVQVVDWGRTRYAVALERQRSIVSQRRKKTVNDCLIFTEHDPVYTVGLRKGAAQHLVWSPEACSARGIEVVTTNRGGDITYHGPGQLVVYPIISLHDRPDLHRYLRDLEEVVIRTLRHFGLETGRREGKTGIWIENRKLCAMGVAARSWITYHGLALNVDPDMSNFSGIVPCGITDGEVSSLAQELPSPPSFQTIKDVLAVEFAAVFGKRVTHGQS